MRLRLSWRLVAFVSLALYAALIFMVIQLLTHNFMFAFLLCVTGLLLLYAGWQVFSARTRGRIVFNAALLGIGGVALAYELIYFLRSQENRRAVIAIIALALIYAGLVGLLRSKYWQMVREHEVRIRTTAHFTHPALIINPKSGDGRAMKAHIDRLATRMGVNVLLTKPDESVEVTAERAAAQGADVLGISGGDGSIGAVAKVAIAHHLPMVVLPGGTRCHFARDLGLEPKKIVDSLSAFQGVERQVDAADFNGRVFLNNVSFGLYADIVDHPEYRGHKLRVSLDTMRALARGDRPLYDLQFAHDENIFSQAFQVLVGVNRYDMVDLFELGHRERMDEGILQVTVISKLDEKVIRELMEAVSIAKLRKRSASDAFFQWTTETFSMHNNLGHIVAGVDGEREEYTTPAQITVLPKALGIYVPAEGVRSRTKSPFKPSEARKVWSDAMVSDFLYYGNVPKFGMSNVRRLT